MLGLRRLNERLLPGHMVLGPRHVVWCSPYAVEGHRNLGSHCIFVGRVGPERSLRNVAQLHYTAGFHQYFRERQGRAFEAA